jgi:hypothetical protein
MNQMFVVDSDRMRMGEAIRQGMLIGRIMKSILLLRIMGVMD